MAAQTLTSAQQQRSVLSPRNVNAPLISPSSKIGSNKINSNITGHQQRDDASLQTKASGEGAMPDNAVDQQAGSAGSKRRFDISEGDGVENKKRKAEGIAEPVHSGDELLVSSLDGVLRGSTVSEALSMPRTPRTLLQPYKDPESLSSSATSSPGSSSGFSGSGFNDSQLTEPDSSRVVLTQGDLGQNAEALKLRLRLAMYKVRTNQINVPFSHLQIRPSFAPLFGHHSLPTPRLNPKPRTPLPSSSASAIPNIRLQKASAEKARQAEAMSSSPPAPTNCDSASPPPADKNLDSPKKGDEEGEDETREEVATPGLPRHGRGLLNAIRDEKSPNKELTSSVVKRGTADVLLSLKLQR